ncbi:hypothetical protein CDAR_188141 [Caerostris darwini]|uniref:Uncharacterized protein n=1 Tax=Caerostris darwini TaxID=1538125 RepID=A0AAV4NWM3_9ARAC|nr:hypothetical protein CDAR_188141 [Caerostris darwini]
MPLCADWWRTGATGGGRGLRSVAGERMAWTGAEIGAQFHFKASDCSPPVEWCALFYFVRQWEGNPDYINLKFVLYLKAPNFNW